MKVEKVRCLILSAYLQVIPSDVGANLPWNFAFRRSFWRSDKKKQKRVAQGSEHDSLFISDADPDKAVAIRSLRKVFKTTDGSQKAAIDGMSLDVAKEEITALLGKVLLSSVCHLLYLHKSIQRVCLPHLSIALKATEASRVFKCSC